MSTGGGNIRWTLTLEALANIRLQGRRSFLALLGVMIGSASIVAMMSFAHIAKTEVMARFEQVGVDVVQVSTDHTANRWLTADDLDHLDTEKAELALNRLMARVGNEVVNVTVVALSPQSLSFLKLETGEGRSLSAVDGCNAVALLGADIVNEAKVRIGQTIIVNGYALDVVGLMAPYPQQAMSPFEANKSLFIGLPCARRFMPREGLSHAMVRFGGSDDISKQAGQLQSRLSLPDRPVTVTAPKELIAAMDGQVRLMSAVLMAVGSIALLVGGVGVMNVMLMSVMERKREIGLRAAIGATPNEIVFVFLIEAVVLSLGGGLLGAIGGVGLVAVGCLFLPFQFSFDPMVLVWGPGVAAIVGLLFGIHPAISAARISPVEALRAD